MIFKVQTETELYVYHNGALLYKAWLDKDGRRRQPSILLNQNGWPNEWLPSHK